MDAITTTLKPFKREFSFIDKKGSRVKVEAEITFRNGYAEFTSCGDCGSGSGQCQDSIHPANEPQKKYLQLWEEWHLNGMHAGCTHQDAALDIRKTEGKKTDYEALKALPDFQKCPSCGYEYGSAWKHRELPEDFEAQLVSTINAIVAADRSD